MDYNGRVKWHDPEAIPEFVSRQLTGPPSMPVAFTADWYAISPLLRTMKLN